MDNCKSVLLIVILIIVGIFVYNYYIKPNVVEKFECCTGSACEHKHVYKPTLCTCGTGTVCQVHIIHTPHTISMDHKSGQPIPSSYDFIDPNTFTTNSVPAPKKDKVNCEPIPLPQTAFICGVLEDEGIHRYESRIYAPTKSNNYANADMIRGDLRIIKHKKTGRFDNTADPESHLHKGAVRHLFGVSDPCSKEECTYGYDKQCKNTCDDDYEYVVGNCDSRSLPISSSAVLN